MTITLYRTALCPRCKKTERILQRLMPEYPDLDLKIIEITTRPLESFRAGVRMIPAIKYRSEILSGIVLDESRIRDFLQRHLASEEESPH
ncbi:MAG: glutaredoxin family protein [Thermodesulfobacteriota bacterium]